MFGLDHKCLKCGEHISRDEAKMYDGYCRKCYIVSKKTYQKERQWDGYQAPDYMRNFPAPFKIVY